MSSALESAWAEIRRTHRDVPKVVTAVSPGRSSACGSISWDGSPVVLVDVTETPEGILHGLLHQAAHSIANRSRSSEGRYHDESFRRSAADLGLAAASRSGTGWSATTLLPDTAARYSSALARLASTLDGYEPPVPPTHVAPRSRWVAVSCSCDPPRNARVSRTTLAGGPMFCGVCGAEFHPKIRSS